MRFEEILLLLLPLAIVLGVPTYIFYRERMVHKNRQNPNFGRKRVIKLTLVNFFLNSVVAFYFFSIFVLTVSRSFQANPTNLFLTAFFIFMTNLTFYGNGVYIMSIVLESYTLPDLKKIPYFKTQFIATHLFHGPISHVFIYSGWVLVLLSVAILDLVNVPVRLMLDWQILAGAGGLIGLAYGVAQIYNGTVPYQFITGLIALIAFESVVGIRRVFIFHYAISSYFFGFIVFYLLTLLIYFIFQIFKGNNVDWDRSGY